MSPSLGNIGLSALRAFIACSVVSLDVESGRIQHITGPIGHSLEVIWAFNCTSHIKKGNSVPFRAFHKQLDHSRLNACEMWMWNVFLYHETGTRLGEPQGKRTMVKSLIGGNYIGVVILATRSPERQRLGALCFCVIRAYQWGWFMSPGTGCQQQGSMITFLLIHAIMSAFSSSGACLRGPLSGLTCRAAVWAWGSSHRTSQIGCA